MACGSDGTGSDSAVDSGTESATWLFTQVAENARVDGSGEHVTLTLGGLSSVTVAFTDRPERESRSLETDRFLGGWESLFGDDPPNAAIVLAEDDERTVPVTIHAARYASGGKDGSYLISALDDTLAALPRGTDLGSASVLIDDVSAPSGIGDEDQQSTIGLLVTSVVDQGVALAYSSLSGNEPEVYGNTVFVWEGTAVARGVAPLQTESIMTNTAVGEIVVQGLDPSQTAYTFAYATGATVDSIAAVVLRAPGSSDPITMTTTVTLDTLSANEIVLGYQLPNGTIPSEFGHWVGLWEGTGIGAWEEPPLSRADVNDSNAYGNVAIVGVELLRGTVYTVGYFTGPDQTNLAATITFVV